MRVPSLLPHDDPVRRWRRLAIANTAAGTIVVALAFVFLPHLVAAVVGVLMVLGVGDTWYLDRRMHRTGTMRRAVRRR